MGFSGSDDIEYRHVALSAGGIAVAGKSKDDGTGTDPSNPVIEYFQLSPL